MAVLETRPTATLFLAELAVLILCSNIENNDKIHRVQ